LLTLRAGQTSTRTSAAHQRTTLDFDDLQSAKSFAAMKAYGQSKLCNILFTRELARRLHGTGVTANCLRPGFVSTRFGDRSGGLISRLVWLAKFFAMSPAKGGNDYLSRVLARRGRDDRTILLQVRAYYAVVVGPRRPVRFIALAAQRSIGRHEGIADQTRLGAGSVAA
jgi:NAD(P)-dependent dehydrogenase (short-subunit alcohol dehydrogenase family)